MNPRVSRSSALASKATGFPIAKLAALLAVGYTLEELPNDITGKTTAAFEPALDYVAVKAPRFDFAKFPGVEPELGTEMQAVGESLGLGRTFPGGVPQGARGARRRLASASFPGSASVLPGELESIREARARGSRRTATSPRRSASGCRTPRSPASSDRRGGGARPSVAPGAARRRLLRGRVRGADAVLLPLVRAGRPRRAGRGGHGR